MDERSGHKADSQAAETIEVGYRNIGAVAGKDYHHKYLIYTDRTGEQRTISGWTGDEAPGLPYGRMQVETNLSYDATNPDHPANANALGQRQYREPIATGPDLSRTWQTMVDNANSKDDRYPYDPLRQNSNTLADSVLRDVGLPEPGRDGFARHWAPASGRQLDERIQPEVPGVGNSSRALSALDAPADSSRTAPSSEAQDDIRRPGHLGHDRYRQVLDAIDRSPNIPPGTFAGERLEQTAANLANTTLSGAHRPQGGQNETLDHVDFVVFNTRRDGLIAGQGEPADPTAKLAYLPAAQDNSTSLSMASRQVDGILQQAQAQAQAQAAIAPDRMEQSTLQHSAPGIGPRVA